MNVNCEFCHDTGYMEDKHSVSMCPHCIEVRRFLNALNLAIQQCEQQGHNKLKADLLVIQSLLPVYSVMAFLEAEARGMQVDFIGMLRTTFHVLPFK